NPAKKQVARAAAWARRRINRRWRRTRAVFASTASRSRPSVLGREAVSSGGGGRLSGSGVLVMGGVLSVQQSAEGLTSPCQQRLDGLGRLVPGGGDFLHAAALKVLGAQHGLVAIRQGGQGTGHALRFFSPLQVGLGRFRRSGRCGQTIAPAVA